MTTNRRYLTRVAFSTGAAVALSLATLYGAGTSQARPPYRLAPGCESWKFDGYTEIIQDDGWTMSFTSYDTEAGSGGEARAVKGGPDVPLNGPITGGVGSAGRDINMTVDWVGHYTPGGLYVGYGHGEYRGRIGSDGYASGTVVAGDPAGIEGSVFSDWRTAGPLVCAESQPIAPETIG
jgi:hypothetical protein